MKDNKYIIRRTLSQERFEVLWTKNKNGHATLKDLAEMDEIINRDEGVRRFVLEEMAGSSTDHTTPDKTSTSRQENAAKTFFEKLKAFFRAMNPAKEEQTTINFPLSY
ncbi:hypothetical protein [Mucilaginibacter sp. MD40]|uniref:hypothetical protein n=1 Tax=Mucilaginibacter sp. MD40 TaxID=2029590 RepID=UPI0011812701|nr:hypothetical protein [Mucilaginibacter sp. MD40]